MTTLTHGCEWHAMCVRPPRILAAHVAYRWTCQGPSCGPALSSMRPRVVKLRPERDQRGLPVTPAMATLVAGCRTWRAGPGHSCGTVVDRAPPPGGRGRHGRHPRLRRAPCMSSIPPLVDVSWRCGTPPTWRRAPKLDSKGRRHLSPYRTAPAGRTAPPAPPRRRTLASPQDPDAGKPVATWGMTGPGHHRLHPPIPATRLLRDQGNGSCSTTASSRGTEIETAASGEFTVRITYPLPHAARVLRADKGINLPDTYPADPAPLRCRHPPARGRLPATATCSALSFLRHEERHRRRARDRLETLGADRLGLDLEGRDAACVLRTVPRDPVARHAPPEGRGHDRARRPRRRVRLRRLAELQEEIFGSARRPTCRSSGPRRSLSTRQKGPLACGDHRCRHGRACRMRHAQQGPHIVQAVHVLDDILRRMQGHQHKTSPSTETPLKLD